MGGARQPLIKRGMCRRFRTRRESIVDTTLCRSFRTRIGPTAPGSVEIIAKLFPLNLGPRSRIRDRSNRLLRAPDKVELSIAANSTNVYGAPSMLGLFVDRHDSLRSIQTLATHRSDHIGNIRRPSLGNSMSPEPDAVVRGLDHVAGYA